MHPKKKFIFALCLLFLVGCATPPKDTAQKDTAQKAASPQATPKKTDTTTSSASPSAAKPSIPGGRAVKSKDGTVEGEIVGIPAAKSKFAKLQIGMTPEEVEKLIGHADDSDTHMTGKNFVPFYYGGDTRRLEQFYKHEGQLTFSNTNNFIAPNALIKIVVNPKAIGISESK